MKKCTRSIEALRKQVKIQCSNGNWNYNPYMHGMANGLICALAAIEGKKPEYLDAPKIWLQDILTNQMERDDVHIP